MNVRIPEDRAIEEVYDNKKTFPLLLVALALGAFLLALLFNFPLERNITVFIEGQIAKNRSCPLSYSSMELGFFLPKLTFKDLTIPAKCYKQRQGSLKLDQAQVRLSMPTLWPLGVKLKVEGVGKGVKLNIFPRVAFGGTTVQIEDTQITGELLSQIYPGTNFLQGSIDIQGHGEIENQKIVKGSIKASSKNLFIPAQTIMAFNLIAMPLNKFELAGSYVNKSFNIKALRLGEALAPLHAEFRGTIKPNQRNMRLSTLGLDGRIKFSEKLLQEVGLIRLFLNGKPKKENYYYMKLDGTLALPKPTIVDPP
jgi:type II secretion system protein N